MVRYKNRYFAVEIEAKDRPGHAPLVLEKHFIIKAILDKVQQLHGDFGSATVLNGLIAKYVNPYTKIVLIRCRHGPHRFIATSLPFLNELQGVPVRLKLIYMGATITKCFKYVIRHQHKCLERYWNAMKSDSDRLKMKAALMEISLMNQSNQ